MSINHKYKKHLLVGLFIIASIGALSLFYTNIINAQSDYAFSPNEIEEFRITYEKERNIRSHKEYNKFLNKDIENLSNARVQTEEKKKRLAMLKIVKEEVASEYNDAQNRNGAFAIGMFQAINSAGELDNPFFTYPRSKLKAETGFTPPKYLRRGIPWDNIQVEENGKIVTKEKPLEDLGRYIDAGYSILPNIRANAKWAVRNVKNFSENEVCSGAPKDLSTTFDSTYGYSKSYYDFISLIAQRFKGKFKVVTIENEMNVSTQSWCDGSTKDEYVRLLLTAQKAYKDNDPKVLVADGGLTTGPWFWAMLEDKYNRAKTLLPAQKISEYNVIMKLASQQTGKPKNKIEDVIKDFESLRKTRVVDGKIVPRSPAVLLGWEYIELAKSENYSKGVNFHYYGYSDALPYIIAYMRKTLPGKKIISNEMGTNTKDSLFDDEEKSAGEMVKKFAIMLGQSILYPNWYTSPYSSTGFNQENSDFHKGSFLSPVDKKSPRLKMMQAATTLQKYLDRPSDSRSTRATTAYRYYYFKYPTETVRVVWGTKQDAKYEFKNSCDVYDIFGTRLQDGKNTQNPSGQTAMDLSIYTPFYEVCQESKLFGSAESENKPFWRSAISLFGLLK